MRLAHPPSWSIVLKHAIRHFALALAVGALAGCTPAQLAQTLAAAAVPSAAPSAAPAAAPAAATGGAATTPTNTAGNTAPASGGPPPVWPRGASRDARSGHVAAPPEDHHGAQVHAAAEVAHRRGQHALTAALATAAEPMSERLLGTQRPRSTPRLAGVGGHVPRGPTLPAGTAALRSSQVSIELQQRVRKARIRKHLLVQRRLLLVST